MSLHGIQVGHANDWFLVTQVDSEPESFFQRLLEPFRPAEEEPLATDRPDFTEASSVVGSGRVLLEGGVTYVKDKTSTTRTNDLLYPQNLLRVGITEAVELRFVWDAGYSCSRSIEKNVGNVTHQDGTTDLLLGTKVQFTDQSGWIPETSLISTLSVPSGSRNYRSAIIEPRFNLLYGWDITERLNIAGSTGVGFIAEPDDRYTSAHQSLTINTSLTKKLTMFNEWILLVTHSGAVSAPEQYLDGGFSFKFTPNFQLDWRIGFGLNDHADDLFTGAGYGIRW